MTNITNDNNAVVDLFTTEIAAKFRAGVTALKQNAANTADVDEKVRLIDKAHGLQKVLDNQGERLTNVRTQADILTMADLILMDAAIEQNTASQSGMLLAVGYITDFLR